MKKAILAKLQDQVRIGGKGTARRKKKVVHRTAADEKKLQNSLKTLNVTSITEIQEVNMIKDDGTVIHFNNPKVQASLNANMFAISGVSQTNTLTDSLNSLRKQFPKAPKEEEEEEDDDDDFPDLAENFDEASKNEAN